MLSRPFLGLAQVAAVVSFVAVYGEAGLLGRSPCEPASPAQFFNFGRQRTLHQVERSSDEISVALEFVIELTRKAQAIWADGHWFDPLYLARAAGFR